MSTCENAQLTFSRTFRIPCRTPFHFAEYLGRRFPKPLGSHRFGTIVHDDHRPHGLFYRGNHPEEERTQDPAATVAVNRIPVLLFGQKAKTTRTVRAFNPPHRQRRRADEFSLDGYLPVGWLIRQPVRTQCGHEATPTYFL